VHPPTPHDEQPSSSPPSSPQPDGTPSGDTTTPPTTEDQAQGNLADLYGDQLDAVLRAYAEVEWRTLKQLWAHSQFPPPDTRAH
jgi:hypothetical protein